MQSAPNSFPELGSAILPGVQNVVRGRFIRTEGNSVIRGMIPSWYLSAPHADPANTIVRYQGVPVLSQAGRPFTVLEVLPERRWAIQPSGELLRQDVFTAKMIDWIIEFYAELGRERDGNPIAAPAPEKDHIPAVDQYVMHQEDPERPWLTVPMHYNPDVTRGAKAKYLYDPTKDDEAGTLRHEALAAAYADPKMRSRLTDSELRDVEDYLGSAGRPIASSPAPIAVDDAQGLAAKLTMLNELLARGEIKPDVHSRRVAELTGAVAPGSQMQSAKALCGAEFTKATNHGAKGAVRFHEMGCDECKALKASGAELPE